MSFSLFVWSNCSSVAVKMLSPHHFPPEKMRWAWQAPPLGFVGSFRDKPAGTSTDPHLQTAEAGSHVFEGHPSLHLTEQGVTGAPQG